MPVTLKEKAPAFERKPANTLLNAPLVPVGNGVYECDVNASGTLTDAEKTAVLAKGFRLSTAERVKRHFGKSLRQIAKSTGLSHSTVGHLNSIFSKLQKRNTTV